MIALLRQQYLCTLGTFIVRPDRVWMTMATGVFAMVNTYLQMS
jgi:hypothetical protein